MIHRLWFRLSLTFAIIVLVTVGTIYVFVSQRISAEMQNYRTMSAQYRSAQIRGTLYLYYLNNDGWDGVQSTVTDTARFSGTHIILVAINGTVVGDSTGELLGLNYTNSQETPVELALGNQVLGNYGSGGGIGSRSYRTHIDGEGGLRSPGSSPFLGTYE